MNKTKKAVLISAGAIGLIYFSLMSSASNGYGYRGHNGYSSGPSFFYFGGVNTYSNRSVRNGSTKGSNRSSFRGGGPSWGK